MTVNNAHVAFERFPGIDLESLNQNAHLQTRIDRKYVVPRSDIAALLAQLEGSASVLTIDEATVHPYSSTYFDTPARDSYMRAARSHRRKFKVRVRSYESTGLHFVEVKTGGANSSTVKARAEVRSASELLTDEAHQFVRHQLWDSGITDVDVSALAPAVTTRYNRATLFVHDDLTRATFDFDLQISEQSGAFRLFADHVIVETKSGSAPSRVDRLLWRNGFRSTRISKFATGTAVLNPELPANKWHKTITQSLRGADER